jgi:polyisoprenoid-binding protein YceI
MVLRFLATSTLGVLVLLANSVQAAESLKADLEKSKIDFIGYKADGKHVGGFKKFDVDAKADFEEAANSSLKIEIKTDSLWSDDEKLTAHLKNPDFFDVRKHPKIVFKTTEIIASDESGGTMKGTIEMLGKTEEVAVPVKFVINDETITIKADFKLDRTKWGMTYGEGKINKEVDIKVALVLNRQAAKADIQ